MPLHDEPSVNRHPAGRMSGMMRLAIFLIGSLPLVIQAEDSVDFGRDIRPVLAANCFQCHGPDAKARKAELRLDRKQGVFADPQGRVLITPGQPDESEIIRRITAEDVEERMPPSDADSKLTTQEIELLQTWVRQGAIWQQHWAFQAVKRPVLPSVSKIDWCRNRIDHFVLSQLDAKGLQPSPQTSGERSIRRVTLDLTGLPPTPQEVDAFLADESADAYDQVVDRLLESKRYGEHMALTWLDAARYADTDGYQNDGPRHMWRWRDWVIDAYNANMRFDQFTIEQLAGDLLPGATLEQHIATGFNRNHRYNSESGLVLEESLLKNAVDRVDTVSTVWMGMTIGCARCHDHKFDPFSQNEYYQLLSYFNNVSESGRAVKFGNSEPWVLAPTKEQQARLAQFDEQVDQAEKAFQSTYTEIDAAIAQRVLHRSEATNRIRNPADAASGNLSQANPADDAVRATGATFVSQGLTHYFSLDGTDQPIGPEPSRPDFGAGVVGHAAVVNGQNELTLGAFGDVHAHQRSTISFWLHPDSASQGVILSRQSNTLQRPGFSVEMRAGHLQFYIVTRWAAGVGAVETTDKLTEGRWVHIGLTNDGSQSAHGMQIYVDGKHSTSRVIHNTNSNTGGTTKNAILRIGSGVAGTKFKGRMDELRFYDRALRDDEIALLTVTDAVEDVLNLSSAQRSDPQRDLLRRWYIQHHAAPPLKQLRDEVAAARDARQAYRDSLPTTMIMDEMRPRRPTHVRLRGVYDQYGQQVEPGVPEIFPGLPPVSPPDRSGLARWLVNGHHPLTARVAVNRYWQKYFGLGLVRTSEDFGVQGEPPSHPGLLDCLASEFVQTGWNVKAMQKLIVTSATYRQSSAVPPHLLERDPENRLLARGPRWRLPAHTIRDQALFVSGLLVEKTGGPSVSPYQPANLWKEMSNMVYRQSKGEDLYRRSLYTIWKRTVAPPSMMILDAAHRETCWVNPKRTNTPLQALILLNETTFVESARHLGQRMILEGGEHPVEFVFRLLTSRRPKSRELAVLQQARAEYRTEFLQRPESAQQLIRIGDSEVTKDIDPIELAANTVLANVLLNLDEVITKD